MPVCVRASVPVCVRGTYDSFTFPSLNVFVNLTIQDKTMFSVMVLFDATNRPASNIVWKVKDYSRIEIRQTVTRSKPASQTKETKQKPGINKH